MSSYQQQAEGEMWDAIAASDSRPTLAAIDDERAHWIAVAAGETTPRRDLYKPMRARFASACDGCPRSVRRGEQILYTSSAPTGSKVYHEACFPTAPTAEESDQAHPFDLDRDQTIAAIRAALKERSERPWSVTGDRGTAWGWINVTAPPKRRDEYDGLNDDDRAELARLFGFDHVSTGGISIAASSDHRAEYVARARGAQPAVIAAAYWD